MARSRRPRRGPAAVSRFWIAIEFLSGVALLAAAAFAGLLLAKRPGQNRVDAAGYFYLPSDTSSHLANELVKIGSLPVLLAGIVVIFALTFFRDSGARVGMCRGSDRCRRGRRAHRQAHGRKGDWRGQLHVPFGDGCRGCSSRGGGVRCLPAPCAPTEHPGWSTGDRGRQLGCARAPMALPDRRSRRHLGGERFRLLHRRARPPALARSRSTTSVRQPLSCSGNESSGPGLEVGPPVARRCCRSGARPVVAGTKWRNRKVG